MKILVPQPKEQRSNHKVFLAIRGLIIERVKHYASLSRRLEGDWPGRVFAPPEV